MHSIKNSILPPTYSKFTCNYLEMEGKPRIFYKTICQIGASNSELASKLRKPGKAANFLVRKKWRSWCFYALCVCDALPQALFFSEKMTFLGFVCPVCVMHCRKHFFFGKNDVPGIVMPCVNGFSCMFMYFHWFSYIFTAKHNNI